MPVIWQRTIGTVLPECTAFYPQNAGHARAFEEREEDLRGHGAGRNGCKVP